MLPLAAIAERCRARGVAVLADGAHAPGAIPLDIPSLGVDWYVGNLHKWLWVPRSSGILWTSPERQKTLHASVISWGLDRGFHAEFDLPGHARPVAASLRARGDRVHARRSASRRSGATTTRWHGTARAISLSDGTPSS